MHGADIPHTRFIMYLYATTSHTTSSLPVSLSRVHLLIYEQSSEGSLKITSEREDTGAHAIEPLHVCVETWHLKDDGLVCRRKIKKRHGGGGGVEWGWRGGAVEQQKSTPAHRAPTKCLAPACCLVWGGRCDLSEWGGWLNDFTSPFQLQQLPIYIVMQIHGLSQMVLFQHRGCTEIWLFIPSTSQVFNAPSSVCFFLLAAV